MSPKKIKYLFIIPCRKNSSRVKYKNKRKIKGKRLYETTILQGLKIKDKNSKLIVNTDDDEIINYCLYNKVDFFKRPKRLSSNNSKISDAIVHMLNSYEKKNNCIVNNIIYYF